jgi:glycosyltransferase involved in cell wall biosynthesis
VGVTLLEDTCLNHRYALPNKLFDYLAAGVPVLASHLPELRSIIHGYNVGRTVDPSDAGAVADAINEMISSDRDRAAWISNARRMAETFNWEIASQRFVRVFRSLIGPARTVSAPEGSLRQD